MVPVISVHRGLPPPECTSLLDTPGETACPTTTGCKYRWCRHSSLPMPLYSDCLSSSWLARLVAPHPEHLIQVDQAPLQDGFTGVNFDLRRDVRSVSALYWSLDRWRTP